MTLPLTPAQKSAFDFIRAYVVEKGIPPLYTEIGSHIGLKSKSSIHRLVKGLEDRGAIRVMPNRPRGIQIIDEIPGDEFLGSEISSYVRQYAQEQNIEFNTAIRELLRDALGIST